MQYTPHYNLNLPEGTDIVNPLIQDNPNYSAIDTAMYDNKLRVIGSATHVKTGTNHAITLADSDIVAFKFVATGDYATGDTFTVDGVTVTARVADGSSVPNGAFKINSTVLAVLDGTLLNLININGAADPDNIILSNGVSVEDALVKGSVSVVGDGVKTYAQLLSELNSLVDFSKISAKSYLIEYHTTSDYVFRPTYLSAAGTMYVVDLLDATHHTICFLVGTTGARFDDTNGNRADNSSTLVAAGRKIELFY